MIRSTEERTTGKLVANALREEQNAMTVFRAYKAHLLICEHALRQMLRCHSHLVHFE